MTNPTLDRERTAQLRAFLTAEAVADGAGTNVISLHRKPGPARRAAVGVAATIVLGGGIFATNALVGGIGPARVHPAVAIETDDGWTTIRILDINANPQAVVDQLEAAGIDVTTKHVAAPTEGPGGFSSTHVDDGREGPGAGVVAASVGQAGAHGLAGLSVRFLTDPGLPAPDQSGTNTDGPTTVRGGGTGEGEGPQTAVHQGSDADRKAAEAALEQAGVRMGQDGSVAIRKGNDNVEVVVFTSA